ncbi:hypothetical protein PAPHI01_0311 [Pancytospora philotis]|nr:hypothetical protein PAPHI01_0311 [Pancytospora philotis]
MRIMGLACCVRNLSNLGLAHEMRHFFERLDHRAVRAAHPLYLGDSQIYSGPSHTTPPGGSVPKTALNLRLNEPASDTYGMYLAGVREPALCSPAAPNPAPTCNFEVTAVKDEGRNSSNAISEALSDAYNRLWRETPDSTPAFDEVCRAAFAQCTDDFAFIAVSQHYPDQMLAHARGAKMSISSSIAAACIKYEPTANAQTRVIRLISDKSTTRSSEDNDGSNFFVFCARSADESASSPRSSIIELADGEIALFKNGQLYISAPASDAQEGN